MEHEFDQAAHTYRIAGRPVPSVTQVLGDLIPGWRASDWHMRRGTAVHACAALIGRGIEFDNDPQIDGQVAACRAFWRDVKPTPIGIEQAVYSERYQYAGTLDLIAVIGIKTIVIDYKATLTPSIPYQCAAYALAECESLGRNPEIHPWGMGVELRPDGTYRTSELYDLRRYKAEWLCLLTAYRVRVKCGVKQQEG